MPNTTTDKTVLVTGATGQQGGAVARHLLQDGWAVRALVRSPEKEAARSLAEAGATLVQGDLYDAASLDDALDGAYGVFSVQNYWLPDVGYEGEIKQGNLIADTAKRARVEHFVYSSVGAADRGEGQRHFDSKWIVEQHVQAIGVPYTIVRPSAFMENHEWTQAQISNGTFEGWGLDDPEKRLQLIAVADIGALVSIVFANPEEYLGQTLEIAGDELTESEAAAVFTQVIGRAVRVAPGEAGQTPEDQAWIRFINGLGYVADIGALRRIHPGLRTFETYLRDAGWENIPAQPMPEG